MLLVLYGNIYWVLISTCKGFSDYGLKVLEGLKK